MKVKSEREGSSDSVATILLTAYDVGIELAKRIRVSLNFLSRNCLR